MSGSRTLYNFTIENQTLQLHWKAQNSNKRSALGYKKLLQRDLKVTDFQGLETRVTENLVFPAYYTFAIEQWQFDRALSCIPVLFHSEKLILKLNYWNEVMQDVFRIVLECNPIQAK